MNRSAQTTGTARASLRPPVQIVPQCLSETRDKVRPRVGAALLPALHGALLLLLWESSDENLDVLLSSKTLERSNYVLHQQSAPPTPLLLLQTIKEIHQNPVLAETPSLQLGKADMSLAFPGLEVPLSADS